MKVVRQICNLFILVLVSHSLNGQPWQRNTVPGPGYQDHDYPAGLGWDHTENIIDLSVSFADPDFRAFVDNEWTSVISEDGINFKPLRMPHIGTTGCSPMSIEFSRYDPSTIYLLLAHNYWRSISPQASPAGLWKSADRGESWEQIYNLPAGAYEAFGNSSGGSLILEDPCPLRSNHIYFGTTSHGLVRSIDAGLNWSTIGSEFSNRRIKTLSAGTYGDNQTVIYTIAEKKMPLHIDGNLIPVATWTSPSNYTARWKFDKNLNDASENGNHLQGSIASWNESAAINSYAANFNGTNALAIENMTCNNPSKFTVSAWVRTADSSNQVIASFDRNEYWELGTRGGAPVFSVLTLVESGVLPDNIPVDTIGFTASEGYLPGNLSDNENWNGNEGFTVDTAGPGSILQDGLNHWKTLTLAQGLPIEDLYSVGIRFSFHRSIEETERASYIFRFGLEDTINGSKTMLDLIRLASPNHTSYALYGVNPGTTNRWPGSESFDESLLGFDNETDSISDELWMNLIYVRGADLNTWTAYYELRNLSTDTRITFKATGEFDVPAEFASATLFPHINSSDRDTVAMVSQRRISRFEYGSSVNTGGESESDAGRIDEVIGTRIDDGDWHHIAGVFNAGLLQLYVDGDKIASSNTGKTTFGSGNTRFGFLGYGSQSEVFGDANTVSGTGFNGTLDDIRIYNTRAFSQHDVFNTYLASNNKNPVVQGQLWRIKINSSGTVEEVKRLHAPSEDFFQVEINPEDPSRGWFIRKGYPNGNSNGGRELLRFSDFGETLSNSDVELGSSSSFRDLGINPGDVNHLYLELGGAYKGGLRYSEDGGVTWLGTDRVVGGSIPSFQSWTAHDYRMYKTGFPSDAPREIIGQPISFVPGVPNELLYVISKKGGLMRSLDFGATFESYATGGPLKDIGQIAVAPSDPGRWGIALYEQGYAVTKDDGKLWRGATYDNNPELAPLPSMAEEAGDWWTAARTAGGIAYNPANPDIMIGTFARQGYIVRSNDGGLNWSYTGKRTPGLGHMDVYWKSANPNRVYAGMMKSNDAGKSWTDIGKVVLSVCESNPDIIVGADNFFVNVNKGSLGMYVSINGGNTWENLPDPPAELVPGKGGTKWEVSGLKRKWNCAADALIAIDPRSIHDPAINSANRIRILMAGRSGIYEYNASEENGGGSESDWKINKEGLENSPHYMQIEPVPWMGFVLFDPRPGFENVVYAATQNDDATLGLWAGEGNKNHSYPGGNNFEPFYMSLDGGITWKKMHGQDFPDAPESAMIESMAIDANGRLFAATTEGIYSISVQGITYPVFTLDYSDLNPYNVDLNWMAPEEPSIVDSYVIFQNGEPIDTVAESVLELHIGGLESMSAYIFTIKAIDDSGKISAVSNTLNLETTLPVGPQLNLTYSDLNHNSVTLNWEAEGDENWVDGYIVYQEGMPVDTLEASVYTSGIAGLEINTSYNFTVKAIDTSGNTIAVSNTQELTTLIPLGPELILEYSNISDTSVDLNWSTSGDLSVVAGYIVFQNGLPIDTVDATVYTLRITGLESETTYYFIVNAIDVSGNIISLTEISSVTTKSSIETTLNLTYSNITSSSVDLTWEIGGDQSEISEFIIYQDNAELDTLVASVLNTTINGLESATSYDFYVEAKDIVNDIIAVSNTVSVTTIISSTEDRFINQSDEIVIYPNPTTGKFYMKNVENGILSIVSMDGKTLCMQAYFSDQSIDVSFLEPGLYILELEGNTKLHLLLRKE